MYKFWFDFLVHILIWSINIAGIYQHILQGFHLKCIESSNNQSAICTAFSSETINYTTIKHGIKLVTEKLFLTFAK